MLTLLPAITFLVVGQLQLGDAQVAISDVQFKSWSARLAGDTALTDEEFQQFVDSVHCIVTRSDVGPAGYFELAGKLDLSRPIDSVLLMALEPEAFCVSIAAQINSAKEEEQEMAAQALALRLLVDRKFREEYSRLLLWLSIWPKLDDNDNVDVMQGHILSYLTCIDAGLNRKKPREGEFWRSAVRFIVLCNWLDYELACNPYMSVDDSLLSNWLSFKDWINERRFVASARRAGWESQPAVRNLPLAEVFERIPRPTLWVGSAESTNAIEDFRRRVIPLWKNHIYGPLDAE